jgi:hypothetical protein
VDLVLEIRNASAISGLRVTAGGVDITARFGLPQSAQLDCDNSPDLVVRANLQSFDSPGTVANTRASLPFINSSDSTTNRRGVAGMPGTFAGSVSAADPYSDTYSTYYGFPA